MRQAIGEATDASTRTASYVFWRTGQILDGEHGTGTVALPSRAGRYRLFSSLSAGKHTTGSAKTRRSLAARPDGPFSQMQVSAPGEVMEIDSTPLDVMVRLDDGIEGRAELTGMVDVATRSVTAAVLQPSAKSADASVLLARTVTPEPMRPGWAKALAMSASALPHRRLSDIDARLESAAARPVIIPDTIVIDHGKVFVSRNFRASCAYLGISLQPARKATGTDKPHIERTLGSVASLFAQFVAGYTGRSPEYRGRGPGQQAVWSLGELQELLDEWIIACWQNRPHDGLRDPGHPGRAFTPNEKYAAMVEAAGYVPVALSADDYVELLPARWHAVNAYGIKVNRRTYDGQELNPFRQQPSGVREHKNLWEIHHDPYDVSRIWVRDHWNGGWITVFWTQLHRVAAPFGELAWDHVRSQQPRATEEEIADAVASLLRRASQGPGECRGPGRIRQLARRDRRVVARTRAAQPLPVSRSRAGTGRGTPTAGLRSPAGDRERRPARRGDPDADLRSLRRGGQAMVTPAPEPDGDPQRRALTTLEGWRQFAGEMPAVPPLLDGTVWQGLDPDKRAAYDDDRIAHHSRLLVVQTPAVRDVVTTGRRLAHLNRSAHYGRSGLIVSGPARTGKTTAITQLGKTIEVFHRRRHPRSGDDIPVVYITVPPAATPKMIAAEFARFLGLPVTRRANITDIIEAVCGVCTDTADQRHLRGRDPQPQHRHPRRRGSLRHPEVLLRAHPRHLRARRDQRRARRAAVRRPRRADRRPVHHGPHRPVRRDQQWATLIAALEASLRLHRHRPGTLPQLARYLHQRTGGMIGSLLWLIRSAAIQAVIDGTEKITRQDLDATPGRHRIRRQPVPAPQAPCERCNAPAASPRSRSAPARSPASQPAPISGGSPAPTTCGPATCTATSPGLPPTSDPSSPSGSPPCPAGPSPSSNAPSPA